MQALEDKSFLRFKIAKILDDMCDNQLQPLLLNTLLSRDEGVLLIDAVGIDNVAQADEMVKIATAVAYLIELSDALEGSKNILSIPLPVGKFLLINNQFTQ